ncbi:phage tail tube protein [Virgibacillus sp. C22-A2]|uniref:Phage tail tube protein n=1 Tax=Virgibacillus tibetensis TaxID=3042313 RepID=A0ABU6K9W0_9BACI|nr:phage tail tube protein [Virgibacillus sp. C22-A2]
MAKNGSNILILVDVNGEFIPCAESTGFSWESSTDMIDVTSKDNEHKKYLAGKRDGTADQEGFYVPNDPAYQALKEAQRNGQTVILRRSEDGTEVEEAEGLISSMSGDAPDNDGATMGISYQLNTDWEAVVIA